MKGFKIIMTTSINIKYRIATMPRLEIIDSGDWIDLRTTQDLRLKAGEFRLADLGVAMQLPHNTEAHIVPRSSTFKKYGVILANQMGIIDESYCGDDDYWQAPLFATRDIEIPAYTRLLQFRIVPTMKSMYPNLGFNETDSLGNQNRGGIGSTGTDEFKHQ